MSNWVGQLEGPTDNFRGFTDQPTMKYGLFPQAATSGDSSYPVPLANKYKSNLGWAKGSGTTSLTLDPVTHAPVSWTPGGTITTLIPFQVRNGAKVGNRDRPGWHMDASVRHQQYK